VCWRFEDQDTKLSPRKTVASGGASSIKKACPFRVCVGDQGVGGKRHKPKTISDDAFDVMENTFDQCKMFISRIMHVEADLLNGDACKMHAITL
jgi:hypothetical protein